MPFQTDGTVIKNRRVKSLYFILGVYCPPIANHIKTGQFMMLKVSDDSSPL
jgi:NAD(P)H-flavin reductase